jgi:predicted TPR repeat methyltransferase
MATLLEDAQAAYADQARVYEQITKLTPDDPEAYLELGSAAAAAGENDKAIEAYERYLELDPESNQADQIREQIDLLKEDVRIVNG